MEQETVRLYTRQNDKTLAQLERDGRIINQRAYVKLHFGDMADHYLESYDWFTAEAAKRVSKPEDVHASIWCSISANNCLKPIPGTVVYVLEVPKDQVIYFDEGKWDYVLNRIYLPADEDDKAYRQVSSRAHGRYFAQSHPKRSGRRQYLGEWTGGKEQLQDQTL